VTTSIPLRCTPRHFKSGVVIIDLAGDITREAESALNQVFAAAVEDAAAERVILNFGDVVYINSSGIALIIGLLARARQQHSAVSAFGLSDHYREIFDITRLSDYISIYSDERTALSAEDWRSR
jgi:anti-anti-sigma factor